jgi:predicted Zn-dependent protease
LATVRSLLERARREAAILPEDPFAAAPQAGEDSDSRQAGGYPEPVEWIGQIADAVAGLDFTGLLAAGPQIRAVRDSAGRSHWFSADSFFIDYSLFTVNCNGENKAVKGLHAGSLWHPDAFARAIEADRRRLEGLRRPARRLPPGEYRAYLAPAAMEKIIGMFSWDAVSYDAWKRGVSPLRQLIEGEAALAESFSLRENFGLGLAPRFNSLGETAPEQMPVIEHGRLKNLQTSSRSARRYGAQANGAEPAEGLRSPEVPGGALAEADTPAALGTGVYLGNLHYLNWSDPHTARVTGMTRHACFWIEGGEIAAPIRDLRFDESLYRLLGRQLEALTRETRLLPATETYHGRTLGGCKVPGAILGALRLTL